MQSIYTKPTYCEAAPVLEPMAQEAAGGETDVQSPVVPVDQYFLSFTEVGLQRIHSRSPKME